LIGQITFSCYCPFKKKIERMSQKSFKGYERVKPISHIALLNHMFFVLYQDSIMLLYCLVLSTESVVRAL
jgi:hypothetical protein